MKTTEDQNTFLSFQNRTQTFATNCFGNDINKSDRVFRFLEEALELAQASGCTKDDAKKLLNYVYDRPIGLPSQEVGGVMVTLAALCNVMSIDLSKSSLMEIQRVESKIDQIREKHNSKPKNSPLPGTYKS